MCVCFIFLFLKPFKSRLQIGQGPLYLYIDYNFLKQRTFLHKHSTVLKIKKLTLMATSPDTDCILFQIFPIIPLMSFIGIFCFYPRPNQGSHTALVNWRIKITVDIQM